VALVVVADEVIRQVALRLPERGLALLRVRDQLRMTLAAYRTLYTSSTDFGARKAAAACEGMPVRQGELDELNAEVQRLRAQKLELEQVCKVGGEQPGSYCHAAKVVAPAR